jgi:hypothetical protein
MHGCNLQFPSTRRCGAPTSSSAQCQTIGDRTGRFARSNPGPCTRRCPHRTRTRRSTHTCRWASHRSCRRCHAPSTSWNTQMLFVPLTRATAARRAARTRPRREKNEVVAWLLAGNVVDVANQESSRAIIESQIGLRSAHFIESETRIYRTMLCSTTRRYVQYSTVLYSTVQYSTVVVSYS